MNWFLAVLTLRNSTISGNSASDIEESFGGGLANVGTAAIHHATIVGNAAASPPGGIYSEGDTSLHHTIVAGNVLGTVDAPVGSSDLYADVPLDASSSFNPIGDAGSAGGLAHGSNGNIVGQAGSGTIEIVTIVDTRLRNNGGPTLTHALVWGSPAIDAGDPEFDPHGFTPPMLDDQRGAGFARVRDGRLDIGAYEFRFNPWHHYADPYDVNGRDGAMPLDVLELINFINLQGVSELPDPSTELSPPPYVDVNNDGLASAADVLALINHLNALAAGQPEGESAEQPLAPAVAFADDGLPSAPPRSFSEVSLGPLSAVAVGATLPPGSGLAIVDLPWLREFSKVAPRVSEPDASREPSGGADTLLENLLLDLEDLLDELTGVETA